MLSDPKYLRYTTDGSLVTNELGLLQCCLCELFAPATGTVVDGISMPCRCVCHTTSSYPKAVHESISVGVGAPHASLATRTPYTVQLPVSSEVKVEKRRRGPNRCTYCKESGHTKPKCPLWNKGDHPVNPTPISASAAGTGEQKKKRKYRCGNCRENGHGVARCTQPCSHCKDKNHRVNKCPLKARAASTATAVEAL